MNKIETKRLILREFKESDVDDVFEFSSNTDVLTYTGEKPLVQKSQAMNIIQNIWFSDYAKYGFGRWAVIHKGDNKLFGFAGLLTLLDNTAIQDLIEAIYQGLACIEW